MPRRKKVRLAREPRSLGPPIVLDGILGPEGNLLAPPGIETLINEHVDATISQVFERYGVADSDPDRFENLVKAFVREDFVMSRIVLKAPANSNGRPPIYDGAFTARVKELLDLGNTLDEALLKAARERKSKARLHSIQRSYAKIVVSWALLSTRADAYREKEAKLKSMLTRGDGS